MRLLLVEDELAISTALSRSMRRWGHEVHVAPCLAEARKLASEHAPEALISDLKLPDGQGLEFARGLGLPFVLMSGYASFDDAVEALRLGCVDFLTKPVALDALRDCLGRLGHRSSSWELCVLDRGRDGLRLLRPSADGITEQSIRHGQLVWASPGEARRRFVEAQDLLASQRERSILAELLQSAPSGEVVINRGHAWWRASLRATVDWSSQSGADRRILLENLADRVVFRDGGILLECTHDGIAGAVPLAGALGESGAERV